MVKYLGKILLCTLSVMVGAVAGGMFSTALRLEQPKVPGQVDLRWLGLYSFAGGVVLSVALTELAWCLPGDRRLRFVIIAWLAFAWLGLNNVIEATIFTTIGGGISVVVTMLFPSLCVAGAVTRLFEGLESAELVSAGVRRFLSDRTVAQWIIRSSAAVIAFPVVYFLFGMPVGLIVGESYRNQAFDLQMPTLGVVIGVQFLRSLVALLAVLPVLIVWPGSRQRFAWTFGLNLFVLSGLYGLIQAYWMPWRMRGIHTIELLFDSLAYGWLLAFLLRSGAPAGNPLPAEKVGKPDDHVKLVA